MVLLTKMAQIGIKKVVVGAIDLQMADMFPNICFMKRSIVGHINIQNILSGHFLPLYQARILTHNLVPATKCLFF